MPSISAWSFSSFDELSRRDVETVDILKDYVELFDRYDEECYSNDIDNAHAYEWLKNEIPIFECPDKDIERAYYFRWWTYRKHIKTTEDGYIITEFLPKVPWSGRHNEINAAAGHHIYEGRWLKNGKKYLSDYIRFFLNYPDRGHQYSAWIADAAWKLGENAGDFDFGEGFLAKLKEYYKIWEDTHGLSNGMFWSIDNYDAMEYSISGTDESLKPRRGARPTLNSYMCADAYAIARFAELSGDGETAEEYRKKGDRLKALINSELYENGFYRAYHETEIEDIASKLKNKNGSSPRELIGYAPWIFGIPPKGREDAFMLLGDESAFLSPFGLTTAERSHPRFLYEVGHECLWNGYVWPFATSQTLTALNAVIREYSDKKEYKKLFIDLLKQYAKSHCRTREDGREVPWIDEVRHPLKDDWSSRTILKDWGWRENKGGYERGKDYNHSTFCDLVISGLAGVSVNAADGKPEVRPCVPDDWEYFSLKGLHLRGKTYDIEYRGGRARCTERIN